MVKRKKRLGKNILPLKKGHLMFITCKILLKNSFLKFKKTFEIERFRAQKHDSKVYREANSKHIEVNRGSHDRHNRRPIL
jgi:hypothetical protein